MKTTYIYGLIDPRNSRLRYVGKANNPINRYRVHVSKSHLTDSHKSRWIRQLLNQGLLPWLIILDEVPSDQWKTYEYDWVKCFRPQLTNSVDGGIGSNPTLESRQRMRKAKLGVEPHNKGKTTPPLLRKKMSISGQLRWERMTDDEKADYVIKLNESRTSESYRRSGWQHTEEAKKKISRSLIGNKQTASLSKCEVLEILTRINQGDKLGGIACDYSTTLQIISNIKHGRSYVDWTGINSDTLDHKAMQSRAASKLTDDQVNEILEMLAAGILQKTIALKYGVSRVVISNINTGKIFKHIVRSGDSP